MPQTPGTWHVPLRAAPIKREGCFVIALTVNVRPMPWIRHSGHHSQHLRHGVRCFRYVERPYAPCRFADTEDARDELTVPCEFAMK